ncbi:MAG TPA: ribonuclease III [Patescibacteria group bacterium]|nr:ribonuclease III [Patescibacteria group bacterium]
MNLPKFKDPKLERQAFVHRSYLNEAKIKEFSNERLEFLGDSILSFVVSNYLYITYPNFEEGILTNLRAQLVNTKSLGETAKELGFGELLILSKGEEESKGRQNQSILANVFEAFLGALFLDQGIEKVTEFIVETIISKAEKFVKSKSFKDPKSLLQEKVQSQKKTSPLYKVLGEEGPAHLKIFTVGVFSKETLLAKGKGRSKHLAEQEAAKEALLTLSKQKSVEKKLI